jgi:hypothetical protein
LRAGNAGADDEQEQRPCRHRAGNDKEQQEADGNDRVPACHHEHGAPDVDELRDDETADDAARLDHDGTAQGLRARPTGIAQDRRQPADENEQDEEIERIDAPQERRSRPKLRREERKDALSRDAVLGARVHGGGIDIR